MFHAFTDRARHVLQLANEEARTRGHEYIGTEHILLALAREGTGIAANILGDRGIGFETIGREVEKIIASGTAVVTDCLPQTPRAKKAVEFALSEARTTTHTHAGTEHLLLGLLLEHEGVAAQVLQTMGLTLAVVREEVFRAYGIAPAQGPPDMARQQPTPLLQAVVMLDRLLELLQEIKLDAIGSANFELAAFLAGAGHKLAETKEYLLRLQLQNPPEP